MLKHYPWKRFWCRSDASYYLGDDGYLTDPDGPSGETRQPHALSADVLDEVPCVALWGDPGLGKSTTLHEFRQLAEKRGGVLQEDLAVVTDVNRLRDQLFGMQFQTWAKSTGTLTILLDSLDECLLRHPSVPLMLVDELGRGYPLNRLRLRIMCRGTEWPAFLTERLSELWGEQGFLTAELLPLRKCDVEIATKLEFDAEELTVGAFMEEVSLRGMQPFAIRPNSLMMLLDAFRRGGGRLTRNQVEMFRDYCRTLCIENPSNTRHLLAPSVAGKADQLLAVARRVAAVTILSHRPTIIAEPYYESSRTDEDLTISELTVGSEPVGNRSVELDHGLIQRCLKSGLFTPHGEQPGRLRWSHWSYPEFLAADFLIARRLSTRQIEDLIFAPEFSAGEQRQIVPQLAETAAWLAMMDSEFRVSVIRHDPKTLLRSQVVSADDESRRQIVDSLLQFAQDGRFSGSRIPPQDYRNLENSALTNQLIPWIGDHSKTVEVRRVALNIVEGTASRCCEEAVRKLLFDTTDDIHLRCEALDAWLQLVDDYRHDDLIPLLQHLESDEYDELRGALLKVLWPSRLSAEEMFKYVAIPKRENFIGAYAIFLWKTIPEKLTPDDVPAALIWLKTQPLQEDPIRRFEDLEVQIIEAAIASADEENVFDALASLACHWAFGDDRYSTRDFHDRISQPLHKHPQLRHRLLTRLVSFAAECSFDLSRSWYELRAMFRPDQLFAVLDAFESARSEQEQRIWGELAGYGVDSADRRAVERTLLLRESNSLFREVTDPACGTIELDSERSASLRQYHEEELEREREEKESRSKEVTHPPVRELVERCLDKIQNGELDEWWRLHRLMTLREDSDRFETQLEYVSDLTTLEAWATLDESLVGQCIDVAERWLKEGEPDNETWLQSTTFDRPTAAGFRSLRLLHTRDPKRLAILPIEVWKKWTPCAATFEDWQDQDSPKYQALLRECYDKAPDQFVDAILQRIDRDDKQRSRVSSLYRLRSVLDERFVTVLVERLRHPPALKPESTIVILAAIAPKRTPAIYILLTEILLSEDGVWHDDTRWHAGALLIAEFGERGWKDVSPILNRHTDESRRIVEILADQYENGFQSDSSENAVYHLSARSLADFYLWLSKEYPHSEDETHEEAHFIAARESVQFMRGRVFSSLKELGTPESVELFRRIRDELPHLTWMNRAVVEAENIARRKSWRTLAPSELINIQPDAVDSERPSDVSASASQQPVPNRQPLEIRVPAAQPTAGEVRQLLETALTTDEFNDLCLDHFPDVYKQFTTGQTHSHRIRLLVDYASKRDRLAEIASTVGPSTSSSADSAKPPSEDAGVAEPSHDSTTEVVDVVIITALEEELQAVVQKLEGVEQIPPSAENVRVFYRATVPQPGGRSPLRIRLTCLAGMGRVKAANVTADAVRQWKPSYVILTGIAGGVAANDAALGDVLIAEQIVDYELQKVTPKGPSFRFQVGAVDERLRNFACHMNDEEWQPGIGVDRPVTGRPNVLRGPVATGDKVVESPRLLKQLLNAFPKLVGVEMEAGGAVSAVAESVDRPGFFMIRGVSDLADPDKESAEVKSWRSYACHVAAAFTIGMLRKGPLPQD